jgi:hypothetical protein
MSLLLFSDLAFLVIGLWLGVAGLVGANRFAYRPLLLLSLGGFLLSISVVLDLLLLPYANRITWLALIIVLLFNIKYRPTWAQQGITTRGLFLFTKRQR